MTGGLLRPELSKKLKEKTGIYLFFFTYLSMMILGCAPWQWDVFEGGLCLPQELYIMETKKTRLNWYFVRKTRDEQAHCLGTQIK